MGAFIALSGLRDSVHPRGLARRCFSAETGGVLTLGFVLIQTRKTKLKVTLPPPASRGAKRLAQNEKTSFWLPTYRRGSLLKSKAKPDDSGLWLGGRSDGRALNPNLSFPRNRVNRRLPFTSGAFRFAPPPVNQTQRRSGSQAKAAEGRGIKPPVSHLICSPEMRRR